MTFIIEKLFFLLHLFFTFFELAELPSLSFSLSLATSGATFFAHKIPPYYYVEHGGLRDGWK